MITGFIKNQELKISQPIIVGESIGYHEAQFFFKTADWDGLKKWSHWINGATQYDIPLTDDKIRQADHLDLTAGEWSVFLTGYEYLSGSLIKRITTEVTKITVTPTGSVTIFPPITPTIVEQIFATIGDLEELDTTAKDNLVHAINEAAESGGGGGGSASIDMRVYDGYIQYSNNNGRTWHNVISTAELKGERGEKGERGQRGERGEQGVSGADGRDGIDGTDGADGVTFTPTVSEQGVISWTNDGGRQNPPSVDLVAAVLNALPNGDEVSY